jgi:hypothetical protein
MGHRVKKRLEHAHGVLRCHRCGVLIRVGQAVVSISRNHRRQRAGYKIYHETCFEETLH